MGALMEKALGGLSDSFNLRFAREGEFSRVKGQNIFAFPSS